MSRAIFTVLLAASALGTVDARREWQIFESHRSASLEVPGSGKPGFTQVVPAQSGVHFTNGLSQTRSLTNQIYLNGSGVAAGDVDGDGWCDLYFCGLDNQNELYRNLGNWKFERITESAGIACTDQASTGAAFVDIDGDGDLDLFVTGIARGTRFFLNDGRGKFQEATNSSGLESRHGSMSLAIADVNMDGLLDVYVVNYRSSTYRDEPEKRFQAITRNGKYELTMVDGRPATAPDLIGRFIVDPVQGLFEQGEPDALYINLSRNTFRRVDWKDGTFRDENGGPMDVPYDWGLSAMFRDINGDRAPDLYVCNDFQSPDRIWLNDGRGNFRSAPTASFRTTSLFSMGVDFADLDGDGQEELFVADMLSRKHQRRQTQIMENAGAHSNLKIEARPQVPRNTLFWNRGNGKYSEIAHLAGLDATEWSWCPVFVDVDLDGRRDLLVTTGHERDAQNADFAKQLDDAKRQNLPWNEQLALRQKFPRLDSPILAFRNMGEMAFTETTSDWGFTTSQMTHGMALADLDNDGDLDLAANALNSPALLYRNESAAPRIALQLRGKAPNTRGIGARITVEVNGLPLQTDQVTAAGRYLSADDFTKAFAVKAGGTANIHVVWPNGDESFIKDARANSLIEISQTGVSRTKPSTATVRATIFEDVSATLKHIHKDEPFDDFQRQALLPRKYSELGPGVCWFDFDEDGWEDLIVGSGRAGRLGYFKNKQGTLSPATLPQLSAATKRDQTGILGWKQGTNHSLLLAFSHYEDAQMNGPSVIAYSAETNGINSILPIQKGSVGALALGDADADGDLDLFVCGRIIPGRYPEAASSFYLRNDRGTLIPDSQINNVFEGVGLVSSATWSDLSGDGIPELLLAIDGGPIRIFTFRHGQFAELTASLGMHEKLGWWQSVSTGDFNKDGRMDIVAGNLGRNSKYQRFRDNHLFYGDLENDGRVQIVEAAHDSELNKLVPLVDRNSLASTFGELHQRFPTFAGFSSSSVSEILGSRSANMRELVVNSHDTMLFLNEGAHFRAQPLPLAAQVSPVFGLAIGDADADGNVDLAISQNLFSVSRKTSRHDAGESTLFLGDGTGGLRPLSAAESGFNSDGEGRGAAFCDFDQDGRLDLALAQNSGATMLYRNKGEKGGIRIISNAGEHNPFGVGAQVRLHFVDGTAGPVHEIRAGEGYWSQAGSTMVLGAPRKPQEIEILWPGGKRERRAIPDDVKEISIRKTD